jgi:FkbM family methyltransferase
LADHTRKIDEALYFIHRLKNGLTVRTGDAEALTAIFTGQKMYVDPRDISVAPHLMLDGIWEPEITKVYRTLIKPDSIVIDIGANFGYFGIIAGTYVRSNGKIFLIEANSNLIPFIRKSIAVNGLDGVATVSNIGIADKETELQLQIIGDYLGSSTFSGEQVEQSREDFKVTGHQKVRATTLDKYCAENKIKHIDVLKVDIEGYEETAYPGMQQIIKQSPNLKLLLEFTPDAYAQPKKFYTQMRKDFKFFNLIGPEGQLAPIESFEQLMQDSKKGGWSMILASKTEISL